VLMNLRFLVGTVEGKGGDGNIEALTRIGFHLIGADHDPRRRRQRGAACIFKAFAGLKDRLFADHAFAPHFLNISRRIGDPPIARQKLHRFVAVVLDLDMVGPDVMALIGCRLFLKVKRLHCHGDGARGMGVFTRLGRGGSDH